MSVVEHERVPEEPAVPGEYLVSYTLSGYMLVSAPDAAAASKYADQLLRALIIKLPTGGISAAETQEVRLEDLAVTIDAVESLEFLMETAEPPSNAPVGE